MCYHLSIVLDIVNTKYSEKLLPKDIFVQGAPENCAPLVLLLWKSSRFNFLDFYTVG